MIYGTFRMSDLGPPDDPDEAALDAIEEDEDFQQEFATEHAWELIDLISTPMHLPTELARKAKALKDAWHKAQWAELESRRDYV